MFELWNNHKYFRDVEVLNGVNLRIKEGTAYTLIGSKSSDKISSISSISNFFENQWGHCGFQRIKNNEFLTFSCK